MEGQSGMLDVAHGNCLDCAYGPAEEARHYGLGDGQAVGKSPHEKDPARCSLRACPASRPGPLGEGEAEADADHGVAQMETILDLHRVVGELDDPTFLRLCQDNAHLHFERDPAGRLVMNPPLGGEGASRELDVASRLAEWNRRTRARRVFSSRVLFRLPP
jgi:hypothetical protein